MTNDRQLPIPISDRYVDFVWDTGKPNARSVPRRKSNTSRAEREFGFVARIAFENGLRKSFDWYVRMRSDVNEAMLHARGVS